MPSSSMPSNSSTLSHNSVSNRVTGRSTAQATGRQITAVGSNAGDTTAIASRTLGSMDILARTIGSASRGARSGFMADTHPSSTRGIGSVWWIRGRNPGGMTGMTMMMSTLATKTVAIIYSTAVILASRLPSAFRPSSGSDAPFKRGCIRFCTPFVMFLYAHCFCSTNAGQ